MPSFKYSARDGQGRPVSGNLSAKSQADAVAELRKRSLIVLDVREGLMSRGGAKGAGGFLRNLT